MRSIRRILIANRGEIACRIIRTCKILGISTVCVYSTPDANALFVKQADTAVHIGPGESRASYLNISKIIEVAKQQKVDAIHPGYGFLSENAEFSAACSENSILFIGPPAHVIKAVGNKANAKEMLHSYNNNNNNSQSALKEPVPLIPGYDGKDQSIEVLVSEAYKIGFPVLIKAAAGGGGKGMRIFHGSAKKSPTGVAATTSTSSGDDTLEREELRGVLETAQRECLAAFGDGTLLLEKYFSQVRHIEIQIFGDNYGNIIHLFERECSIQRRYQKVVEETPSVVMTPELRQRMGCAAVTIAKLINYVGAGTVEFLFDSSTNQFYFLEVNTRLQVEHAITEVITGLDLVKMQIFVAMGYPLSHPLINLTENTVKMNGLHAIECRLCAEDSNNNFLPSTGVIQYWSAPQLPFCRFDTGVESGSVIPVFYDSLLAKIIVWGQSRDEAIYNMIHVLRHTVLLGTVTTNKKFLLKLLANPHFRQGNLSTHFIDHHMTSVEDTPGKRSSNASFPVNIQYVLAALLYVWYLRRINKSKLSYIPSGWRNNPYKWQRETFATIPSTSTTDPIQIPLEYQSINEQQPQQQSSGAITTMDVRIPGQQQPKQQEQQQSRVSNCDVKVFRVALQDVRPLFNNNNNHPGAYALICVVDGVKQTFHVIASEWSGSGVVTRLQLHCSETEDAESGNEVSLQLQPRIATPHRAGNGNNSNSHILSSSGPSGEIQLLYTAPMPGKVLKVLLPNNAPVTQGQAVLVMESMKMETKIIAEHDGVLQVAIQEGDIVQAATPLFFLKKHNSKNPSTN